MQQQSSAGSFVKRLTSERVFVQQQASAELKGGKAPSEGFVQFPYYFSGGWCSRLFAAPSF